MSLLSADGVKFELTAPVLVVGAGACGLVAALEARDRGADVLVLERDASPSGSTSLSSGMIPACGTRIQRDRGVADSVAVMAADIQRKNHGRADPAIVSAVCRASGRAVDWLADDKQIPLALVEGFLYPGHTRPRMHAPPSKTGTDLLASLLTAAGEAGADIVPGAHVTGLFATGEGRVAGVRVERPDGGVERIGCGSLLLACNGFGGDPEMVREHIPEMAGATYFGHAGNTGDAIRWGRALGAATGHLGAYQGHGSVAAPHAILITWALMMEGGIQVNSDGVRFSNEHQGYSEQAVAVLAQPEGLAWDLYDERRHALGREFEDYRAAERAGAIRTAETAEALAAAIGVSPSGLAETVAAVRAMAAGEGDDPFGRDFTTKPALEPPYYAIRVTGALFHTQGGLLIDPSARVVRGDGTPLPNLFAGGGAACGVSGPDVAGYLSGNGLLTAVTLGRLAGASAAEAA